MRSSLYIIVILLLSFSSCSSYEKLPLDVLIPAKHSLQPEIKSVLLIDNALAYRDTQVHEIQIPTKKFFVDTIWNDEFPAIALDALKQALDDRNFFDSVHIKKEPLRRTVLSSKNGITWELVNKLCEKYHVQSIISIDDYLYHTKINVGRNYEGNLHGYLDANAAILWRVYNNLNKTVLYKEIQIDTISYDTDGVVMNAIASKLPSIKWALTDLANYMGTSSANDIAPYWETQQRGFYATGNYRFMQAAEMVRIEKWGEAIKIWKYIFNNSTKKVKARAAYNLALAAEVLGDYSSASYWIDQSLAVFAEDSKDKINEDRIRVTNYAIQINNRLKVLDKLKIQVGGL
jgi:hypothetical protein